MATFDENVTITSGHALVFRDSSGHELLRLVGELEEPAGPPPHVPGGHPENQQTGRIFVLGGRARLWLGETDEPGQLWVSDGTGRDGVRIEGQDASVNVGGSGLSGRVWVFDASGRATAAVSGDGALVSVGTLDAAGTVEVKSAANSRTVVLDGDEAVVTVGTTGAAGEVRLRSTGNHDAVVLDGSGSIVAGGKDTAGALQVMDGAGHRVLAMTGFTAALTVGDENAAGTINVVGDDGEVKVTVSGADGDIRLMGADLAEDFAANAPVDPGSVVVAVGPDTVEAATTARDKRVIGVASGAGGYAPALRLGKRPGAARIPVAITGRVACWADAGHGPITPGDLLTTSPTRGHAMRADDPRAAAGSIIGKALSGLESGTGLIHVLLALG